MTGPLRALAVLGVLALPLAAQTHSRSPLVPGQNAELRLDAGPPGGAAWFVFGFGGLGPGVCLPPASSPCLGVLTPLAIAPPVPVDAAGAVRLPLPIPAGLPLVPLATQALTLAPAASAFAATNAVGGAFETIAAFSDEFDGAALAPEWRILHPQAFDWRLDGGDLVMTVTQGGPALTWFADGEGPFVYRQVTGDFDVQAEVRTYRETAPSLPPPLSFNLGGLCVRDPVAPPGDHDWVHLTVGAGTGARPIAVEDKNTIDSSSDLLLHPVSDTHVELRMTRRGSFVQCYWRPPGALSWNMLRGFDRGDLPATVQVGLNVMFWPTGTPDIEQRVSWIRFAE
ncbi:MAG: hypothetical protein AAF628_06045 [Planctomycetota bacterium]